MNASPCFDAAIASVQIGKIAPLGTDAVPSGFVKTGVSGSVMVQELGLDGDQQADLSVHGGIDKAVYAYPASRYPEWSADFPALASRFGPGSMGENLTIVGIDEDDVCIGDSIRHGDAILQVTQPRLPCYKLGLAFNNPKLVRAMTRTGRSGWYYRVQSPGQLAAGATLTLLDRPNPGWSLTRFNLLVRTRDGDTALRHQAAELAGLSVYWRDALRRAATR